MNYEGAAIITKIRLLLSSVMLCSQMVLSCWESPSDPFTSGQAKRAWSMENESVHNVGSFSWELCDTEPVPRALSFRFSHLSHRGSGQVNHMVSVSPPQVPMLMVQERNTHQRPNRVLTSWLSIRKEAHSSRLTHG